MRTFSGERTPSTCYCVLTETGSTFMAWRWGTGPVFAIEVRAAARRWQTFALRVLFIASLLLAFFVVWNVEVRSRGILGPYQMAVVGQSFYFALIGTQVSLLLLAAPAATAGAVCVDKARGTLLHLLVTDLSNS